MARVIPFNKLGMYMSAPEAQAAQQAVKASGAKVQNQAAAVVGFADWLKSRFPDLYSGVIQSRPDLLIPQSAIIGMAGLSADNISAANSTAPASAWGQQISDFINQIAGPLVGTYQQKTLIDINVKRAEQGLPPIDASGIAPTVNVGLPPAQLNQITALVAGGIVVMGILFYLSKRKR